VAVSRWERTNQLAGHFRWADEQEVEVGIGVACPQSAVNHDGGCPVPAEEVNGDPRDARLQGKSSPPRCLCSPTLGRVCHARLRRQTSRI
jgi:hypothetical protein